MKIDNFLYLILLVPFTYLFIWYLVKNHTREGFYAPIINKYSKKYPIIEYFHYLFLFFSIALLIFSLTGPKKIESKIPLDKKGKAIIFCIDISSSMKALDFGNESRINIAKRQINSFIEKRPHEYYGLILFAKTSFVYVPLTFDNKFIMQKVEEIEIGMVNDGTAIGYGVESSINLLKNYEGAGKVIILLSDGANKSGIITPLDAAKRARKNNIKIYPIAIGKEESVPFPTKDDKGNEIIAQIKLPIDLRLLNNIANETGVENILRADDKESFENAFIEIDKLESTVYKSNLFYQYKYNYIEYIKYSYILFIVFLALFLFKQKVEF